MSVTISSRRSTRNKFYKLVSRYPLINSCSEEKFYVANLTFLLSLSMIIKTHPWSQTLQIQTLILAMVLRSVVFHLVQTDYTIDGNLNWSKKNLETKWIVSGTFLFGNLDDATNKPFCVVNFLMYLFPFYALVCHIETNWPFLCIYDMYCVAKHNLFYA